MAYGKVLLAELWRGGRRKAMLAEAGSLFRHGAVQLEPDPSDPLPVWGKWLLEARDWVRARGRVS